MFPSWIRSRNWRPGLHEADVPLLDQVEELEAAVRVLLGDRNHQAKVGLDELALGLKRSLGGDGEPVEGRADIAARHPVLRLELPDGALDRIEGFEHLGHALRIAPQSLQRLLPASAAPGREQRLLSKLLRAHRKGSGDSTGLRAQALELRSQLGDPLDDVAEAEARESRLAQQLEGLAEEVIDFAAQALPRIFARATVRQGRQLLGDLGVDPLDPRRFHEEVAATLFRSLRRLDRIEAVDHVLQLDGVLLELLGQQQYLAQAKGRSEDRELAGVLTLLDALGDGDLALAREQGDLAHLAQVDADRVVGGAVLVRGTAPGRAAQRCRLLLGLDHADPVLAEQALRLGQQGTVAVQGSRHVVDGEKTLAPPPVQELADDLLLVSRFGRGVGAASGVAVARLLHRHGRGRSFAAGLLGNGGDGMSGDVVSHGGYLSAIRIR
jgi:hypothetical protein